MGKLIAFPRARLAQRRQSGLPLFQAFDELSLLEHAELKLVSVCAVGALLLLATLALLLP